MTKKERRDKESSAKGHRKEDHRKKINGRRSLMESEPVPFGASAAAS